jgi:hypothetical protein
MWVILLLFPGVVLAEDCWGQYDPTDKSECEYQFLSEEDAKIDEYIRNNLTAWWTRKRDNPRPVQSK